MQKYSRQSASLHIFITSPWIHPWRLPFQLFVFLNHSSIFLCWMYSWYDSKTSTFKYIIKLDINHFYLSISAQYACLTTYDIHHLPLLTSFIDWLLQRVKYWELADPFHCIRYSMSVIEWKPNVISNKLNKWNIFAVFGRIAMIFETHIHGAQRMSSGDHLSFSG